MRFWQAECTSKYILYVYSLRKNRILNVIQLVFMTARYFRDIHQEFMLIRIFLAKTFMSDLRNFLFNEQW